MLIDKPGRFATFRLNSSVAFLLGVAVGLGIASYAYNTEPARPAAQLPATPVSVAPSAAPVASSGVEAKVERLAAIEPRPTHPAPKEDPISRTVGVDTTLFDAVDAGRAEMTSAEPPTELVAEVRPLEAPSATSSLSTHVESAQENDMRSESEKVAPQMPATADASLLPHERLQ